MSDQLRGQVPGLDDEQLDELTSDFVQVFGDRYFGEERSPMTGVLKTVLFDKEPEIEFTTALEQALASVSKEGLRFEGFELHHGDTTVPIPGPFRVKAARIHDIDHVRQTCVFALSLQRS